MPAVWKIWSPRRDVPPYAKFRSLQEVRDFLKAQGVTFRDDKEWRVLEEKDDGTRVAECAAGVLLSDQGAAWKSILAGMLP